MNPHCVRDKRQAGKIEFQGQHRRISVNDKNLIGVDIFLSFFLD